MWGDLNKHVQASPYFDFIGFCVISEYLLYNQAYI